MSTNQSWGGRFAEGPREAVAAYTDSQTYDRALYAQDIRGSQAHARMLGRQGVITPDEAEQIVNGLDAVKQEIESGAFVWKPALEDVHMNIEAHHVSSPRSSATWAKSCTPAAAATTRWA